MLKEKRMVHELLGKLVTIDGLPMKIGFLRADCDAGVVDPHYDMPGTTRAKLANPPLSPPALLVRLSDLSLIRKLDKGEDYDKAVLAMKGVPAPTPAGLAAL